MYIFRDDQTAKQAFTVAIMRGILSVPGHAIDAVFMGIFYGKAKYCQCSGDNQGKNKNIALALFVPILTHGFYDFCLFLNTNAGIQGMMVVFLIFEVIITVVAFIQIHKASKGDTSLPGIGGTPFYQMPYYPYNYYANQTQQQYQPYPQNQYQGYQNQYQQPQQQQQGYYTPNGYTQPNQQYQGYQQNPYQQGQQYQGQYQQGGYQQQQYQQQNYNNYNNYNNQ
jgi:hypothetical protein